MELANRKGGCSQGGVRGGGGGVCLRLACAALFFRTAVWGRGDKRGGIDGDGERQKQGNQKQQNADPPPVGRAAAGFTGAKLGVAACHVPL